MGGIVKALDSAMASNNPEKVAETMEKFEKQFENLDVRSSFVADAMSNQAAISTPENEVTDLLHQVSHARAPIIAVLAYQFCRAFEGSDGFLLPGVVTYIWFCV